MPLCLSRAFSLTALSASLLLAGCRSAFVQTTLQNRSGADLTLLELKYPSQSFGLGKLGTGADFHYRFKIQGSGAVKLLFTDKNGREHLQSGPELDEGQEGTLGVIVGPDYSVRWDPNLYVAK